MNYKIGDRVKIRSWESMQAEFGLDEDGDIKTQIKFITPMRELCGKSAIIKGFKGFSFEDSYVLSFESVMLIWSFTDEMLEPPAPVQTAADYFRSIGYGWVSDNADLCGRIEEYKNLK